jgi:hypothetical protein
MSKASEVIGLSESAARAPIFKVAKQLGDFMDDFERGIAGENGSKDEQALSMIKFCQLLMK